ncbi:MAG TPA: thioredoxin-disulfide reductase [Candidatus Dojkabacteria bacterium]|jgi:thioredoxin reductase (NADPH)
MSSTREVIIIGSGPAGLTAAIYQARADLKPLIIAGTTWGGQLMTTTDVENYPGYEEGIEGPELMTKMLTQAKRFGAEVIYKNAEKVDFSDKIKKVWTTDGEEFSAKSIIIATGSSPRKLGLESEERLWGKGVSSCATCDGAFYKEKVVAVIGGGDSAMEEATFLTRFASKVYIIHRRDEFKASQIMQDRAKNNDRIEILWNTEVREILGEQKVEGAKIFDNKKNTESEIKFDGFFLGIGHIPNTKFLGGSVELDSEGFIVMKENSKTSVEGVFVAGDVKDHRYQQAITAAGMGCMAALDSEKYLEELAS